MTNIVKQPGQANSIAICGINFSNRCIGVLDIPPLNLATKSSCRLFQGTNHTNAVLEAAVIGTRENQLSQSKLPYAT
ncbi:hypothetical protein KIN_40630 [Litoreibacter roseus]|uniref:Uncharacterized protein n=1 Tax=Litoreibacter roseus TaxID=2601869 RepID=A0A6N6JN89_9RHOB|nr:hypothetical protein KIN_40630 [Litoreibacter roseus]